MADACEVVPAPPDPTLAELLRTWWQQPRRFGCATARETGQWCLVAPDPSIWCGRCAMERFEAERRCCYCGGRIRRVAQSDALLYEMRGTVQVFARAHHQCAESAGKGRTR